MHNIRLAKSLAASQLRHSAPQRSALAAIAAEMAVWYREMSFYNDTSWWHLHTNTWFGIWPIGYNLMYIEYIDVSICNQHQIPSIMYFVHILVVKVILCISLKWNPSVMPQNRSSFADTPLTIWLILYY